MSSLKINIAKVDEKEYAALREEIVNRIQIMNTHNVAMITVVVAIWAVAGLLFGEAIKSESETVQIVGSILSSFLMLVPTFIITPLAVKSGDNLDQIASIAGYMKVFVELPTILNENEKRLAWEAYQKKGIIKKSRLKFFNSEYLLLSVCAIVLYVGIFIASFVIYSVTLLKNWYVFIIFGLLLIFGIFFAVVTSKNSSSNSFLQSIDVFANSYLDKLAEMENWSNKVKYSNLEYCRKVLNIREIKEKAKVKNMDKYKIVSELRTIMCSGRFYDPIHWCYYDDENSVAHPEYAAVMDEYQAECRKEMYSYNLLPNNKAGEKKKQKLLDKIFGECIGFRKIEAPFNANYGGKHTKLNGAIYVNFNLTLIEDGEIEIGDKVMIGPNVTICTAEHPQSRSIRNNGQGILRNKKIIIGNNVWIGADVKIFGGAIIGDNCIIGAGSIVLNDMVIPPNKVAYGIISKNTVSNLKDVEE